MYILIPEHSIIGNNPVSNPNNSLTSPHIMKNQQRLKMWRKKLYKVKGFNDRKYKIIE